MLNLEPLQLIKHNKEVQEFIKFLNSCKYSGSFETKLDLGYVIKLLSSQLIMINELNKEVVEFKEKVKKLENK
jgi:hypothetical protein